MMREIFHELPVLRQTWTNLNDPHSSLACSVWQKRWTPIESAERIEYVGRRRAQRQRSHENADHQAHIAFGPGRRELHANRVDACHANAGDDAQRRRRERRRIDGEQQRIGDGPRARGRRKKAARIDAIGEPQEGARETADDESRLDAARQRRLGETRQMEFGDQCRNDR